MSARLPFLRTYPYKPDVFHLFKIEEPCKPTLVGEIYFSKLGEYLEVICFLAHLFVPRNSPVKRRIKTRNQPEHLAARGISALVGEVSYKGISRVGLR
jgi:hypothetical protein